MLAKCRKVDRAGAHDFRHAGPPVGARHGYAIHIGIDNAGKRRDGGRHFGRRDIFALPAKRVPDAIDEIVKAAIVPPHQIAGAKPSVTTLEHVAQNLFFRRLAIRISIETGTRIAGDAADRLARLVRGATRADPAFFAQRRIALDVELHQRERGTVRNERRRTTDGPRPAFDVEQGYIGFGRRIELENLRDVKSLPELLPDVAAQPVAAAQPQPMLGFATMRGAKQEIAAQFADILEQRAVETYEVTPDAAHVEVSPDHHGATDDQARAGRYRPADAVIHRQAIVHAIGRSDLHHAGEPVRPYHQPVVADFCCLPQARGA